MGTEDSKPADAKSPQLQALEDEKARRQLEKEIAQLKLDQQEIERKGASASVTTTDTTPLSGATTVDEKGGYPLEGVAYHALRCAAQEAGARIRERLQPMQLPSDKVGFLIVDTLNVIPQIALYTAMKVQIDQITRELSTRITTSELVLAGAPPALEAAPEGAMDIGPAGLAGAGAMLGTATNSVAALAGLVSAAAGVAALFRREYTIAGRTVAIKQDTARLLMAEVLANDGKLGAQIAGFRPKSALIGDLNLLIQRRAQLTQTGVTLTQRAAALPATDTTRKAQLEAAAQAGTALVQNADEFLKGLTASDSAATPNLLTQALAAEQMQGDGYSHLLYVQIESAGGDIITEKSLWRSGTTTFLGGAVLSYVLVDRDGRVVSADVVASVSELTTTGGKGLSEPTNVLLGPRDLRQAAPDRGRLMSRFPPSTIG